MSRPRPAEPNWLHDVIRKHLAERGASFYRDILAAALRAAAEQRERPVRERDLLDALWELVWATEVTNDTFGPLRALRWPRSGSGRRAGAASTARPRFASTARMGPPEAAGRWSLVSDALATAVALRGGRRADRHRAASRAGAAPARRIRGRDARHGRRRGR